MTLAGLGWPLKAWHRTGLPRRMLIRFARAGRLVPISLDVPQMRRPVLPLPRGRPPLKTPRWLLVGMARLMVEHGLAKHTAARFMALLAPNSLARRVVEADSLVARLSRDFSKQEIKYKRLARYDIRTAGSLNDPLFKLHHQWNEIIDIVGFDQEFEREFYFEMKLILLIGPSAVLLRRNWIFKMWRDGFIDRMRVF